MANIKTVPVGSKFNMLTVIEDAGMWPIGAQGLRKRKVKCLCDCGGVIICYLGSVKGGLTKSCGCLNPANKYSVITDRGDCYKSIKAVWRLMNVRCYKKNGKSFPWYGGSGIEVCDEWKNNFPAFYFWAITNGYQKGLEIDRINNDSNYSPDNCRFSTRSQNMRNTRRSILLEINGEKKTLIEWADFFKINSDLVRSRYNKGWHQENLFIPSRNKKAGINVKPPN